MRHLYSTEHTAAREVALEVCRKSAEIELIEEETLRSSERIKLGSAEDLFGFYEPQDSTYSTGEMLTFKELSRLLHVEISMMHAHNNKQLQNKANNPAKRKSGGGASISNSPPTLLNKRQRTSDIMDAGSVWIDTLQSEGTEGLLHNGSFPGGGAQAYLGRDEENSSLYDSGNDMPETPGGRRQAPTGPHDGQIYIDENGLSLQDTLANIAQSQMRLSTAVENLVEVQTNIFVVLKELITAIKQPDS